MINDRISLVIDYLGISASQLATKLGVQRSGISHILSGRNRPGIDFIIKLLHSFPQINSDWLLTGKGEMIKSSSPDKILITQESLRFPDTTSEKEKEPEIAVRSENKPFKQEEKGKSGAPMANLTANGRMVTDKISRASKVIILYTDGTYDEFQQS